MRFLLLLSLSMSCFAQVVIKDHYVGQTVGDFMSSEPAIWSQVKTCQTQRVAITCGDLLSVMNTGAGTIAMNGKAPNPDPSPAVWTFENGRISELTMWSIDIYDVVREELTKRIASEPQELVIPYRNGFGAEWNTRTSEWITKEVHVVLTESNDPTRHERRPWLRMESRAKYDADQKVIANRPSSLDR